MPFSFPIINIDIIMPEIILVIFASIVLLMDAFMSEARSRLMGWISIIGIGTALFYAASLWNPDSTAVFGFSGMVVSDNLAGFARIIILMGGIFVSLYSIDYLKKENLVHGEYFALILFALSGMTLLSAATDFITIFLGLEMLSIALYVLAGFARANQKSDEASLKYFILSSFATAVTVYGIALVYGSTGTTNLSDVWKVISATGISQNPLLFAGMALIISGLSFKVALVPFHVWTPDVYEGAPTTVTMLMSFGTKTAAFIVLSRVLLWAFWAADLRFQWVGVLWVLSALTMFTGNILAVSQSNIKRLLAYSSIGHAGYISMGLISGVLGISSLVFYLLIYMFMIAGALGVVLYLERQGHYLTIQEYSGLAGRYPVPAAMMAIFMFGLAGIPPTAGFIAKFYIFSAAVQSGYVGLTVIGVLTSVLAVYYYLKVIVNMYMRPAEGEAVMPAHAPETVAALAVTAIMTILLGIYPTPVLHLMKFIFTGVT